MTRAEFFSRARNAVRNRVCRLRGAVAGRLLLRECGKRVLIGRSPIIVGGHRISIGDGVSLADDVWLNVERHGDENGLAIVIGEGSGIGRGSVISAARSVVIERRVTLAPGVLITDHQHAHDDPELPIGDQGITDPKPVRIEQGAWIGAHAKIMPGVTIGRNAVVGANAVVTRSVLPRTVVVGCPARPISPRPS